MKLLIIIAMIAMTLPLMGDGGAGESIMARLDRIVIPKVDCEDASLEEILEFARIRVNKLDIDGPKELPDVSFLISRPAAREQNEGDGQSKIENAGVPRFRYVAKNVAMIQLLSEFGRQAHMDVHVTDFGIIICAPGHPPFPNAKVEKGKIIKTLYRVPKLIVPEAEVEKP